IKPIVTCPGGPADDRPQFWSLYWPNSTGRLYDRGGLPDTNRTYRRRSCRFGRPTYVLFYRYARIYRCAACRTVLLRSHLGRFCRRIPLGHLPCPRPNQREALMYTTVILDIIGNVFVLAGVLIFSIAAIGLLRFTDTYQRISAVGTAAGLGITVLDIGVYILTRSWQNFIKLLIILFIQLATSSIGSMGIARSAYLTGSPLRPGHFDHLAEDQGVVEDIGEPDEDVEEPEENVDEAAQNDNWG